MISADQYSDKRVLSQSHKKLLGETIKSCDDMIIVTRGVHANNFECFHNPLLITERSFKYEVMFPPCRHFKNVIMLNVSVRLCSDICRALVA